MTSTSTSSATRTCLGVVALALGLAACGSQVAGPGGSGSLPVLRIGTAQYGATDAVAPRASGTGTGSGGQGQDPYPLRGTLPTGPSSAKVYRFGDGAVDGSDVATLASVLGVTATPVRHPHGWDVATKAGEVRVRDDGSAWSFSRGTSACPSYAADIDDVGGVSMSGCAVAVPPSPSTGGAVATGPAAGVGPCPGPSAPGTPQTSCTTTEPSTTATTPATVAAPTDSAALGAAGPVLSAAGLDPAQAGVLAGTDAYPVRTVVLDPIVDGLRTSGARTVVDVDADGVLGATGVLTRPAPGDSYPTITASAALALLRAMPRPEIAVACMQGRVCPGIGPTPISGAVLGLSMASDAGAPVLVPSWLFTVAGSDEPIAVVAVEQTYLGDPTASPDPAASGPAASSAPGPGPSDGGGAGSVPGSSGAPATPVPVTDPPTPAISVQSVSLGKDATTLVLGAVGGVCDDYSGTVQETSTTITVGILATPQSPGRVCAAMAREFTVTVALAAPWNDRTIIDAGSGTTLRLG